MINEKSYLDIASKFAGDDSYITESADAKKDEKDGEVIVATEDEKTGVESVPAKNKQQPKAVEGNGLVPKIEEDKDDKKEPDICEDAEMNMNMMKAEMNFNKGDSGGRYKKPLAMITLNGGKGSNVYSKLMTGRDNTVVPTYAVWSNAGGDELWIFTDKADAQRHVQSIKDEMEDMEDM